MPATKTNTKTETKTVKTVKAVATESAAPVATPAPVAEAPKKKVVAKKETTESAPAVAAPVATEATAEVSAPVEGGADESLSGTELIIKKMHEKLNETAAQIHSAQANFKALSTALKALEKEYTKERKEMAKKAEKYTRKNKSNRNPSGFAKKAPISSALADFLGLPHGSELARTDATRQINTYIKSNNLQNPQAKKEILCDAKLKALLQPTEGEVVHFFNLQRFLKKHFISGSSPVATA